MVTSYFKFTTQQHKLQYNRLLENIIVHFYNVIAIINNIINIIVIAQILRTYTELNK